MSEKLNDNNSCFLEQPNKPSFFKILISNDFSNHLRIPPQFLNHLGNNLHNEFTLWNRQRRCWSVCAEKSGETLYFEKGWGDFVRDNALQIGDFLLFFYTGNSNFDVIVYGKNCCEKIPVITNTTKKSQEYQTEEKLVEETQPHLNGNEIIEIDSDDDLDQGKSNAIEAAKKFASTNPYFQILMNPTYAKKSYMNVPRDFADEYINEKRGSIILQVSEKSWSVKLSKFARAIRFCQGWHAFARDNCIRIGDICIFEKIGEALHVTIYRA